MMALISLVAAATPVFPSFDELALKPEDGIEAVPFTVVLVDATSPGVYPGMEQSLTFYEDFALAQNELMRRSFATVDNPLLRYGLGVPATFAVNIATDALFLLPFGAPHQGWMHEEWHRAVMSSHGIDTFDTLAIPDNQLAAALGPRFYPGSSGSVIGVSDEELAAFKRESPGDYVRMSTAGIESQYEVIRRIERDQFFFAGDDEWFGPVRATRAWNTGTLWLNAVTNFAYLAECDSKEGASFTDEDEKADVGDVLARDFTGLDCDAFVYDMFRPREPYEARGPHPSGVGVARFRSIDDFNEAEKKYADDTVLRGALAFLDPALFNVGGLRFDDVAFGQPLKITGRLGHMLSPIGSAVEVESLAQLRPFNAAAVLRLTATPTGVLPSVDLSLVRMPFVFRLPGDLSAGARDALSLLDPTVATISLDVQGWLQPHDLIADSDDLRAGGLLRVDVGVQPIPNLELVATGLLKSEGFAPGVLSTGPSAGAGLSVKAWLY